MFGSKRIEGIEKELAMLRRDRDWLVERNRKLDGLFTKDHHGTVRPKVDLLADRFNRFEIDVWNALNTFQKKIEKLEKK